MGKKKKTIQKTFTMKTLAVILLLTIASSAMTKPRMSKAQRRKLGMTYRCSAAPFKNECCANGTVHSDNCNMCLAAKVLTFGAKDCDASCKDPCRRMEEVPRKLSRKQRRK